MNILSADNLHILSQRNEKLHSMWTITIDDHTCHDEVLLMIQRAFHDPDAFIEKLFHDHSLPAVKDVCVCVRSASGFLRYLSSIVEDPFLIWAKCERNENASSLQDMAKKTCLRRFRLCQPYVITPGFFPCRHHAMSKTFRTVGL